VLRQLGKTTMLGKVGYAVSCVLASVILVASGAGYYAQQTLDSIGTSPVGSGGPSTGAMNILIMGLESRTYWNGAPIDHHLGVLLNTGTNSGGNGGEATNTLILIHVFAGGQKAVGFSIPRDDYVTLYGTLGYAGTPKKNKIDDAYNAAFQQELINDQKNHPGWSSAQDNLDATVAGQQATVDTVEALTGVTINKFAELNLVGFYQLAYAFGGVEVCINKWAGGGGYLPGANLSDPVQYNSVEGHDAGSGFRGRAGLQHLDPVQTLQFVRQRDNLPQGDIDRTQRQQAVIDYVLFQLKHEGALSDVGKLGSLMSVAKNYMQASAGWDLLQFAGEMDALTPGNLSMSTLPSTVGPNIPGIGSVNIVDVPTIQRIVQTAFSTQPDGITTPAPGSGGGSQKAAAPKPSAGGKPSAQASATPAFSPSSVTVDTYNSSQTQGLATDLSKALVKMGYTAGAIQSWPTPLPLTTITYGAGTDAKTAAGQIAKGFGLTATASSSVAPGHVQVVVGGSVTFLPAAFGGQPTSTATPTASASAGGTGTSSPGTGSTASGNTGDSNTGSATTPLAVEAKAKYGIPCVY
jgi:LCP family protein required for cell wall assembly